MARSKIRGHRVGTAVFSLEVYSLGFYHSLGVAIPSLIDLHRNYCEKKTIIGSFRDRVTICFEGGGMTIKHPLLRCEMVFVVLEKPDDAVRHHDVGVVLLSFPHGVLNDTAPVPSWQPLK